MSLFGSLYSSVTGIQSQGMAIGIISDNISNASTVGYKAGSQYFGTLVTNSGSTTSYSPGGVRAQNRQLVTQQGLLQSTSSPLDIAISGNGFFVVQDGLSASNNPTISYTRAGSFRTDSLGNFYNGAGLYLKAWPLDENGDIPASNASLDSLEVVNIGSASGDASATTKVTVGIKLDAGRSVFLGAGAKGNPGSDSINIENRENEADDILVPNANLVVGDDLTVTLNNLTTYNFEYGGFTTSNDIAAAPLFGSSTATNPFTGISDGDTFLITRSTDIANPITFTYKSGAVNKTKGEFNSLQTLAEAIDSVAGLSARVVSSGGEVRLYAGADDAREGLTFTDPGGADFPGVLGLADVAAAPSSNRFSTMYGLNLLVNEKTSKQLVGTIDNPTSSTAQFNINAASPLDTIEFASTGTSDFLAEFGITSLELPPAYDGNNNSMAAGTVKPQFQRSIEIYDSLGASHTLTVGFVKVANNIWRAEIYTEAGETKDGNKQIAAGEIVFNNDGSLASIDSTLTTEIDDIDWANDAVSNNLEFDFGTSGVIGVGKTNGLSQFEGAENVKFLTQNGAASGLLDSVSIDKNGYIIANFNNGQTQRLYKIPLADFANPNGLANRNGNTFTKTFASGEVNLKEPGTGSVGSISPSSLEAANTEIAEELTDMIVAQRAYQASAKVITTADRLLDELNRLTS